MLKTYSLYTLLLLYSLLTFSNPYKTTFNECDEHFVYHIELSPELNKHLHITLELSLTIFYIFFLVYTTLLSVTTLVNFTDEFWSLPSFSYILCVLFVISCHVFIPSIIRLISLLVKFIVSKFY